jgi:hypothetical protein
METIELLPRQMRIGEIPFANAGGVGLQPAEPNRCGNASSELIMTVGMRFGHTVLALRLLTNPQFLSRSELFPLEMAD